MGFSGGSAGKESACNEGDLGLIPGLGRSPEERKGYPLWLGEFHGLYSPWGRKQLDTTEWLSLTVEKTGSEKLSDLLKVIQLVSDFGDAHQKLFVGKNVIEFLIFTWSLLQLSKELVLPEASQECGQMRHAGLGAWSRWEYHEDIWSVSSPAGPGGWGWKAAELLHRLNVLTVYS